MTEWKSPAVEAYISCWSHEIAMGNANRAAEYARSAATVAFTENPQLREEPSKPEGRIEPAEDECGGGESCWYNSETGYAEYCPKHEAMIADKAMESPNWKPVSPQPQEGGTTTGDAADRETGYCPKGGPEIHVFYELVDGLAPIPWEVYKVEDVERIKWRTQHIVSRTKEGGWIEPRQWKGYIGALEKSYNPTMVAIAKEVYDMFVPRKPTPPETHDPELDGDNPASMEGSYRPNLPTPPDSKKER